MKSETYKFSFIWNMEEDDRTHFTVRLINREGKEVLQPILSLCQSINTVGGFLYTHAKWVKRSRSRIPGWDKAWVATSSMDFKQVRQVEAVDIVDFKNVYQPQLFQVPAHDVPKKKIKKPTSPKYFYQLQNSSQAAYSGH